MLLSDIRSATSEKVADTERRRAERIVCAYPVRWAEGLGTTRDLNEFGVLFETDQPFSHANPIKLAISIPPMNGDGVLVHALCEAKVVRVEEAKGPEGRCLVAASFSSMKLH